ncbi:MULTISPECIES: PspA/IM30 family protein [unclassified Coleofasciculus]|uniref:PspA/IM30 family protein n=1 Tax=unclassified Coleofasciculus TaxID=2692782 RepID=UPI00187FE8CC|nr:MULTISPECIES: PspA/IM30 family protein [unclassified Coleofasciculus]MBE9125957.1 PspA/IM30 family protein [Coleofasciculus sp. LEGE 07081]MBE9148847.1 PspA/IM30 family protein [Coleofasciculus sp. LEGE 07092]
MALGDRISRIVKANFNDMTGKLEPVEGTGFIATGAATGAGVSATVGGMGLVGGFGGISVGMAPVVAAGAMAGAATYGGKKAIENKDASALGAAAVGAMGGAWVSSTVGGMGLAFAGTAVGVGMAPVAAAGAVVGLGAYGLNRLLDQAKTTDNPEKVLEFLKQIKLSIQQEIACLTASNSLIQQQHSQSQHEVNSWHRVAEAAMKQEREDLARKALERKLSHQQNATTLKAQLEQVTARIEALRDDLSVIERIIAEV